MWKTFREPELFVVSDAVEPDLVISLAVVLSLDARLGDEAADLLLELVEFDFVSCDRRASISRERWDRKLFLMKDDDEFEHILAEDDVLLMPVEFNLDWSNLEPVATFKLFLVSVEFLWTVRESNDFGPIPRSDRVFCRESK